MGWIAEKLQLEAERGPAVPLTRCYWWVGADKWGSLRLVPAVWKDWQETQAQAQGTDAAGAAKACGCRTRTLAGSLASASNSVVMWCGVI